MQYNDRFALLLPDKETPPVSNWRFLERWANNSGLLSIFGGVMRTLSGTVAADRSPGIKWLVHAEAAVVTTNAGGDVSVTFPIPFPNGLVTVLVSNGSQTPVAATLHTRGYSLAGFTLNVYNVGGAAPYAGAFQLHYIAIGW